MAATNSINKLHFFLDYFLFSQMSGLNFQLKDSSENGLTKGNALVDECLQYRRHHKQLGMTEIIVYHINGHSNFMSLTLFLEL